jgi:hypothetical protein
LEERVNTMIARAKLSASDAEILSWIYALNAAGTRASVSLAALVRLEKMGMKLVADNR